MRVFVAVNRIAEIGYRQTTAMLVASLLRRHHSTWLVEVGDFSLDSESGNRYLARAIPVPAIESPTSTAVANFAGSTPAAVDCELDAGDLLLIRTNPGRDPDRGGLHLSFLDLCQSAQRDGIRVVNAPEHLAYFASKASLSVLPESCRPRMLVTHHADLVADFVRSVGTDCVVKPQLGSRGRDVIRVSACQAGIADLIDQTFSGRGVVVQQFVHAATPGDMRVVVCQGQILEYQGHVGGIARHPQPGEFRANMHLGASSHPVDLTDSARETVQLAADLLWQHGIWLAGIDIVGSRVIEFNVFSTGGLFDASRYAEWDFADQIVAGLIRQ